METTAQSTPRAQYIERYGPYGRQTKPTFDIILETTDRIKKVNLRTGSVVDGIGFDIIDQLGNNKTIWFGSNSGQQESVQIDTQAGEYITQISGLEGEFKGDNYERNVAQIWIHTNVSPVGYGPYGLARDCRDLKSFESPSGPIVGLFGASGNYLQSIGVSVRKDTA
ncbi:hypothetical protein RND81_12G193500 [Saponaria officinalis]|uniref:Jacalin-type lectin domain-containing protein n=1 Tax=Saponaria officinalis TaxID=3572 RepID=A0AAW1HCU5_SAPOF